MQNAVSTSDHAAFHVGLNFLIQKSVLIGVHFGISWYSIPGSSFASDVRFHGFELANESCTATDSTEEDRLLGLNMSEPEEEQSSARSDAASSKRILRKDPERSLRKSR